MVGPPVVPPQCGGTEEWTACGSPAGRGDGEGDTAGNGEVLYYNHMNNKYRRRWRVAAAIQDQARRLRREMTPAERRLWQRLRRRQLNGAHFRKQHAVGPFIVDFFCAKAGLVIEVDGYSHAERGEYDTIRTRWLSRQRGYRVLRFTNAEAKENLEAVVDSILAAVMV